MAEKDQEFIEYVVKELVDNPSDVKVERKIDERGVLLELTVNPADMGKIIGKEGRTAKALRTLLRVIGAKNNARVNLKVIEPEGSERPPRVEREASDEKAEKSEEKPEAKEEKPEVKDEEQATEVM